MKSKVTSKDNQEFPMLMTSKVSGQTVLMTSKGLYQGTFSGVVVDSSRSPLYNIGYTSDCWQKDSFEVFIGTVMLSN